MEVLVSKEILTRADVRGIFKGAEHELMPFNTEPAAFARALIKEHILPRFTKDGDH
jgi:hypothetical protein